PEKVRTLLQAARRALDETIAAIRQVEGYGEFLAAPEFVDIVAAAKGANLVYLAVTKAGGLALFVNEKGEITPVWLPELTEETLLETLENEEAPYSAYLQRYDDWRTHPKEHDYIKKWHESLKNTTELLWQNIMAPVVDALPKSATVTLIPVGLLGLLPLHAAWRLEGGVKRYALDELTISYAPNARSLTQARKVAHRVTADRMLAIDEPK
ncbi:CHAT domain-containing protein, partial [Moraxella sp.]|uniref:CHAT domain-containing protein n=1 Tax=Moraxella sp. TaxID=479 RepID=UPI0026334A9E